MQSRHPEVTGHSPKSDGRDRTAESRIAVLLFAMSLAHFAGAADKAQKVPDDSEIEQFLSANAWCSFSFNKNTGSSRKERGIFDSNGVVSKSSGAESYHSSRAGTVAGQSANADEGRWRVRGATLHLSRDGVNWEPQQVQVSFNSNGSPILKSDGKEYARCQ